MRNEKIALILLITIAAAICGFSFYKWKVMGKASEDTVYNNDEQYNIYSSLSFEQDNVNQIEETEGDVLSFTREYKIINPEGFAEPKYILDNMAEIIQNRGKSLTEDCVVELIDSGSSKENNQIYKIKISYSKAAFDDNPDYFNQNWVNAVFEAIVSRGYVSFVTNYNQENEKTVFNRDDIMLVTGQSGVYGVGGVIFCFMVQDAESEVKDAIKKYGDGSQDIKVLVDGQVISKSISSLPEEYEVYKKPISNGDIFIFNVSGVFDCNYIEELIENGPLPFELQPVN